MSFNPDDENEGGGELQMLKEENDELRRRVQELSSRLARYELEDEQPPLMEPRQAAATGRKTISFANRSAKQHQGRMNYLVKKLEKGTREIWSQEAIADIISYCSESNVPGSGPEFRMRAAAAYGLEDLQNLDDFAAILQAHV